MSHGNSPVLSHCMATGAISFCANSRATRRSSSCCSVRRKSTMCLLHARPMSTPASPAGLEEHLRGGHKPFQLSDHAVELFHHEASPALPQGVDQGAIVPQRPVFAAIEPVPQRVPLTTAVG